jgi:hypothetical protein
VGIAQPLEFLDEYFISYIEERRREPRADVLTDLALGTFPDGSTPEPVEVSRVATFLFGAAQETTARLIASAMQILAEHPDIQQRLRDDRSLIPQLVEETLRFESPVKSDFRLTKRTTTLGGGRISLERIFDRMGDVRISEEHHGPPGDRHYDWEPTYILRGLTKLHIDFTPLDEATSDGSGTERGHDR